jgi:predicted MFS family arabinose efflux permease
MLRTGGFRTVLIATVLFAACFVAANGLFTPQTSPAIIIPVLIGAGFLRSLFFTSANALVFADVEDRDASQATAIAAASQQVSIALGVAVGGGILEATAMLTGEPVGLSAFSTAFFIVAVITILAVIPFMRLSADAGDSVSGHRLRDPDAGEQPPVR